jgi:hypothetical protein
MMGTCVSYWSIGFFFDFVAFAIRGPPSIRSLQEKPGWIAII